MAIHVLSFKVFLLTTKLKKIDYQTLETNKRSTGHLLEMTTQRIRSIFDRTERVDSNKKVYRKLTLCVL